jgi:hypothetical protein
LSNFSKEFYHWVFVGHNKVQQLAKHNCVHQTWKAKYLPLSFPYHKIHYASLQVLECASRLNGRYNLDRKIHNDAFEATLWEGLIEILLTTSYLLQ